MELTGWLSLIKMSWVKAISALASHFSTYAITAHGIRTITIFTQLVQDAFEFKESRRTDNVLKWWFVKLEPWFRSVFVSVIQCENLQKPDLLGCAVCLLFKQYWETKKRIITKTREKNIKRHNNIGGNANGTKRNKGGIKQMRWERSQRKCLFFFAMQCRLIIMILRLHPDGFLEKFH